MKLIFIFLLEILLSTTYMPTACSYSYIYSKPVESLAQDKFSLIHKNECHINIIKEEIFTTV